MQYLQIDSTYNNIDSDTNWRTYKFYVNEKRIKTLKILFSLYLIDFVANCYDLISGLTNKGIFEDYNKSINISIIVIN